MDFTIVDGMFVIHDMEHLIKSLKLNLNISCDVSHHEKKKVPEIKVEV